MLLTVEIEPVQPDTAVVKFSGPVTLGTSLHVADVKIQKAIDDGYLKLVLNLSGVPYVDSAGLGTLIHASGAARERGGEVRLCGLNERISGLLRMTRTDTLLPVDPELRDSLAALDASAV
jgi:anti-sigma B factor antagonist